MSGRRLLAALAIVVGIALIVVAVVYWAEPAKSLPSFFPGHKRHSHHHHRKDGAVALVLGLAFLVLAWFQARFGRRAPRVAP